LRSWIWYVAALLALLGMCEGQAAHVTGTELRKNWSLQSSCRLKQGTTGELISTTRFRPEGWVPTEVPHTVEGAQVDAKVFPFDPFVGMNLRKIPGTTQYLSVLESDIAAAGTAFEPNYTVPSSSASSRADTSKCAAATRRSCSRTSSAASIRPAHAAFSAAQQPSHG